MSIDWANAATIAVSVAGAMKTMSIVEHRLAQRNGGSRLENTIARLDRSVGDLKNEIGRLVDRLGNIPTKLELFEVAEKNRHSVRNDLQIVEGAILNAIAELKQ